MSTLIERLEEDLEYNLAIKESRVAPLEHSYYYGYCDAMSNAIEVVKQYNEWVSVSERLPDDRSLRYELFTPSDDMSLRHRFCHCDDVKKSTDATHWRVAQQPPSEAQS